MNGFQLTLTILLQRIIELLAFYLILANIDGNNLKESFVRLVKTKQRSFLYGNVIVSVVYLSAVTVLILTMPVSSDAYLIDHVIRPFVAFFLLRRAFSLQKALLSNVFVTITAVTVALLAFVASFTTIVVFLVILIIIMLAAYLNYFSNAYTYLSKKKWLSNMILILSAVIYLSIFIVEFSIIIGVFVATLFLLITFYFDHKNRRAVSITIDQLKNATTNNFIQVLQGLASEYKQANVLHQYIIETDNIKKFVPALLVELEKHKKLGTLKDYECITKEGQIKINAVL